MGPTNLSRRSFLKSSAATATGAVIAASPLAAAAAAAEAETPAAVTSPTGAAPAEPVMAYVHNVAAGEVTILKGTSQTTYNDPALVKRLLAAAPGDDA
jgi:anaerobic selenocysteine-containing dehydrogenase